VAFGSVRPVREGALPACPSMACHGATSCWLSLACFRARAVQPAPFGLADRSSENPAPHLGSNSGAT